MLKRLISVSEKSKYLTISVNVYESLGATCSPQQLNTTGPMCVCVSEFKCSLFLQETQ